MFLFMYILKKHSLELGATTKEAAAAAAEFYFMFLDVSISIIIIIVNLILF